MTLFKDMLSHVHNYYPIGAPTINTGQEDKIRLKIAEKLDDKSDLALKWQEMIRDFRQLECDYTEDLSFLQFPNLMASIDFHNEVEDIKATKSLVVCISLLAPFYTYYYRYSHRKKLETGSLFMGYWAFFDNKSYAMLKPKVDLAAIDSSIQIHFPHYKFANHYWLMINEIEGGLIYGNPKEYYLPTKYSFYQFLFDSNQPEHVFN